MTETDSFAYIPLFAIGLITLALLALLFISKKRSTARVSFIAFLACAIIIVSSVCAAVMLLTAQYDAARVLSFYAVAIFVAALIALPYCIMLATFEPQKIEKLVPKSYNEAALKAQNALQEKEAGAKEEVVNGELSEADASLLDISRDFMAHSSEACNSDEAYIKFLEYVNKTVKEQVNADGAAVLMVDDFEDLIAVKAFEGDFPPPYKLPSDMPHKPVRVATNFKFASFPLRDNIFGEIATAGRPELITKPELDSRIYQNGPEEFLECGSYIIVPMKVQGVVIGVVALARKNGNTLFTNEDLKTATTLSDFAAATIKNIISVKDIIEHSEISKESEIASKIQNMLKPAKLPLVKGLQLGVVWAQADGVCGDYYDIIAARKDRVSFIMSDIAGKGTSSMLVMTMIRSMLRLVANTTQSAATILEWVNKGLSSETFSTDHFGSVAFINYNPIEKEIEVATGGVIPVYYYNSETKAFVQLTAPSEPIGVEKSSEYKDVVQKVKSGDIIVTYTDGVVEALNDGGQQYTKEKLLRLISLNYAKPPKELANLISADVKKFTGTAPQHDDETLLLIKIQ